MSLQHLTNSEHSNSQLNTIDYSSSHTDSENHIFEATLTVSSKFEMASEHQSNLDYSLRSQGLKSLDSFVGDRIEASLTVVNYQQIPRDYDVREETDKKTVCTQYLLRTGDHYLFTGEAGDILLVVEKDYLTVEEVERVGTTLTDARRNVAEFLNKKDELGRLTIYVYDEGPYSTAHVPGAFLGEQGILLKFAKENEAPDYHELTHMLAGNHTRSTSLSEGLADFVQQKFRPEVASSFVPANADIRALAKEAIQSYPELLDVIGSPSQVTFPPFHPDVRHDFYFASCSFVTYLATLGDLDQLMNVYNRHGYDGAYQEAYGLSRESLIHDWLKDIGYK